MKRIYLLILLLLASINTASAAIVTNISNLLIWGDRYDVTIHTNETFNDIWDVNGNGDFTDDTSGINRPPTFWGQRYLSERAAEAVLLELGLHDGWYDFSDATMTPWAAGRPGYIWASRDIGTQYNTDWLREDLLLADMNYPANNWWAWVSYEPVTTVPIPAAVWLFGSALVGFGFITRKHKKAA